ncbi:uncharacterized protein PHACADRAFT_186547 [Phanerochaete carnosa HHB-10118-sp]|uniref:F-box domain-containing protein n=1 Tax=Phanerochaete carnosa (strain HHB-10118-sp) TaxID=650164 RepID=K5W0K6_PHACS|nr:uncharacterized protein PHACADRAFT_186547 [Phanerochaete carnosa HHB-10118-sp]EKM52399.1 hypothetical protein PHACADRAFT_186547 [Phanerochaete carnosa HHB-10118-sp]
MAFSATSSDIGDSIRGVARRITSWAPNPALTTAVVHGELEELDTLEEQWKEVSIGLKRVRAALNRRKNSLARVHTLPVEILRIVFTLYCAITDHPVHPGLTLLLACSHWRDIVLQCPAIWTRLNLSILPRSNAELLCAMSQQLPLQLRFHGINHRIMGSTISFLRDMLWRTSELDLCVDCDFHTDTGRKFVPFFRVLPTDNNIPLECFKIRFQSIWRPADIVIGAPLFGGHAPHLKYLELDGLRLAWNSGFYCNLSTLKIVNCRADARGNADRDIRYALRDSPNLEVLEISLIGEGEAYPLHGSSLHASSRVELKSLHTLILGLPVRSVHQVLRSITADSIKTLHINIDALTDYTLHTHLIPSVLDDGVLPSGALPPHVERVDLILDQKCCLAVWKCLESPAPMFSLSWPHKSFTGVQAVVLQQLSDRLSALGVSHAKHLSFALGDSLRPLDDLSTHPFAPLLMSSSLVRLDMDGAAPNVVLPILASDRVASAASNWPHLAQVQVTMTNNNTLHTYASDALVKWLEGRAMRPSLNFRRVSFALNSEADQFTQTVTRLAAAVTWDNCNFFSLYLDDLAK